MVWLHAGELGVLGKEMTLGRTSSEELILRRFGEHLRRLRKLRGLTQDELATQAGFSRTYYTEIEKGKRNVSILNLCKLAECLGIKVTELLEFDASD